MVEQSLYLALVVPLEEGVSIGERLEKFGQKFGIDLICRDALYLILNDVHDRVYHNWLSLQLLVNLFHAIVNLGCQFDQDVAQGYNCENLQHRLQFDFVRIVAV